MNTSEQVNEIFAAIAKFQAAVTTIPRDKLVKIATKSGASMQYKYAPLDQIVERIRPAMAEQSLGFIQSAANEHLITRVIHASGQWIETAVAMPAINGDIKAYGAALTYTRRYGLSAALGIATDDDDERSLGHQRRAAEEAPDMISAKQVKELVQLISDSGRTQEKVCEHYKVAELSEMTADQADNAIAFLRKGIKVKEQQE